MIKKRRLKIITIFLSVALLLGFNAVITPAAANDNSSEVKIEADGTIDYDVDRNLTTATKKVRLSSADILIECENLVYDANTGQADASGGVKLTNKNGVYHTTAMTYNLKQQVGSFGQFTGVIDGQARDYQISGEGADLKGDLREISSATITRCPKPAPDYLFLAKRISFNGDWVQLFQATLSIKGVKVLYFPSLTFDVKKYSLPKIGISRDQEDGWKLNYKSLSPINETTDWRFRSDLATGGDSDLGVGIGTVWGNTTNDLDLLYFFDHYWGIEDQLNYNTNNLVFKLELFENFGGDEKSEFGIGLTRKYWPTPLGRLQVGVLARQVSGLDGSAEYGGSYGGYRVDYSPYQNIVLSYLWLKSLDEKGIGFGDFLDEYQIGGNGMYDIKIPLAKEYSFDLTGSYNFEESEWLHRVYRITKETCCFRTSVAWDEIENFWEMTWNIKF